LTQDVARSGHPSAEEGAGRLKINYSERPFGREVESSGIDAVHASQPTLAGLELRSSATGMHFSTSPRPPAPGAGCSGTSRPTRRSITSSQNGAGTESWSEFMIDCGPSCVRARIAGGGQRAPPSIAKPLDRRAWQLKLGMMRRRGTKKSSASSWSRRGDRSW
jgi:hypothetical protein